MGIISNSYLYDLTFILISLALYFYIKIQKRLSFYSDLGVPHVRPKSFFDYNIMGIYQNEPIGEKLHELYTKFENEKYVGFFQYYTPCLLVRDPDVIMTILKKDFTYFNDHGLVSKPEVNALSNHIFNYTGGRWKALRKILTPAFGAGKLKGMFPLMEECVNNLTGFLDQRLNQEIEMKDTFSSLTLDVIGSCAFGVDAQSLKEENSKFKRVASTLLNLTMTEKIRFAVLHLLPFKGVTVSSGEKVEFFRKLFTESAAHRRKTGVKRGDFVDQLVQLQDKGSIDVEAEDKLEIEQENASMESIENVKIEITESLMISQTYLFFIAGHETTANALSFLMFLFGKHPETQEKAREEVKKLKEKYGEINYESTKSMEYINACVQETLRLFPPIVALTRRCVKDYKLNDGFVVKKDTFIAIPLPSIHRDPKYFPEPDKFDPERFLRGDAIRPGTFFPFGDGPRICLGMKFAQLEMKLAIGMILENYQICSSPKSKEPLRIRHNFLVPSVDGGTWISFKKLEER